MIKIAKKVFVYMSTHTYTNLSRLFLRLFIGVILLQLGINQIAHFEEFVNLPGFWGLSGETSLSIVISTGVICSTLMILGLFTRVAILPLLVMNFNAVLLVLNGLSTASGEVFGMQPMLSPFLITGILAYFLIAGPGKISLDYILARYIVSSEGDREEEQTLEDA